MIIISFLKNSQMSLKDNLNVLGKTKESTKLFLSNIKNENTKIDKDGNESVETISYKIKFNDSISFMATSLSKLVDTLTEGIHKIKCKDCDFFLNMKALRIT